MIRRLLLYSHDSYGLGHFRRNLSIAEFILGQSPAVSVLAVTGSPRSHSFRLPAKFDYVKLPAATKNQEGAYRSRDLDLELAELIDLRARILLDCATAFKPDLVLVDHAPFGLGGELLPMMERMRGKTKFVFGMRDIIDDPDRVRRLWASQGVVAHLKRSFDAILYYGDRRIFDPVKAYGLPAEISRRMVEVGYVTRNAPPPHLHEMQRWRGRDGRRLVVVTVGGGGDGNRILSTYLRSLRAAGPNVGFDSLIVTGPLMSPAKKAKIESLAAGCTDVQVAEFIPDLHAIYGMADLVVCMGGYNTLAEVLASRARALVIPRIAPRLEQLVRACSLADQGLVDLLHPRDMGGSQLLARVQTILERNKMAGHRLVPRLQGAQRTWESLQALHDGGSPGLLAATCSSAMPDGAPASWSMAEGT